MCKSILLCSDRFWIDEDAIRHRLLSVLWFVFFVRLRWWFSLPLRRLDRSVWLPSWHVAIVCTKDPSIETSTSCDFSLLFRFVVLLLFDRNNEAFQTCIDNGLIDFPEKTFRLEENETDQTEEEKRPRIERLSLCPRGWFRRPSGPRTCKSRLSPNEFFLRYDSSILDRRWKATVAGRKREENAMIDRRTVNVSLYFQFEFDISWVARFLTDDRHFSA